MIMRACTNDERLIWLALWWFFLANWVGQDYLSPQALSYFFYLLILAILLTWFRSDQARQPWVATTRWQRLGTMSVLLLTFLAVVSSHPLTPFFLIAGVGALAILGRIRPRTLPIVMASMTGAWLLLFAQPFLAGHTSMVTGSLGQVSAIVSANLTDRVQGTPEHRIVIGARVAISVVFAVLAVLGAVRRFRTGHRDLTLAVLATTPLLIIPLQVYGGEIVLRAYLFSLPFIVFFAASIFFTTGGRAHPRRSTVLVAMGGVMLLGGFLVTRYGNERIDYITYAELAGVRHLYEIAPPGATLVSTGYTPWKFQGIEKYDYRQLDASTLRNVDVPAVLRLMTGTHQAYFLFTRSEAAQVDLFYGVPGPSQSSGVGQGWLDRLVKAMINSGSFVVVYRNADTLILTPVDSRIMSSP
jgi:hypothetical protein